MYVTQKIQVPAKLLRLSDYVPYGGVVVRLKKSTTMGLFPKSYITATFYTKDLTYVDFTTESHIPINVERTRTQIVSAQ